MGDELPTQAPEHKQARDDGCIPGSRQDDCCLRPFLHPRYWGTWWLYLSLRGIAKLPFPVQLSLGRFFGRVLQLTLKRQRRVVACNLAACFPELPREGRQELARRHFESVGLSVVETAIGWFTPLNRLRRLVRIEGRENLEQAMASGRGIILLSAHFTSLEIGFGIMEDLCPGISCVYRPQRNAMMDVLIRRGRRRFAAEQIPRADVRALVRRLKAKGIVVYIPDQTHVGNQGTLMPFFGEPAMTNTATAKLAQISGAIVLPYMYRRLPGTEGYIATIMPAMDQSNAEDAVCLTRRWVQSLEQYIRLAPEQYLWVYKKFKCRPLPLPDLYETPPGDEVLERPKA